MSLIKTVEQNQELKIFKIDFDFYKGPKLKKKKKTQQSTKLRVLPEPPGSSGGKPKEDVLPLSANTMNCVAFTEIHILVQFEC